MKIDGNIGADGVRFRMFFGILFFAFALMMMALLTVTDAPLPLRLTVFIPAWISALCLLQSKASTCVFLAARGACSTEMGTHRIEEDEQRLALVRRAGRIHLQAVMVAAAFSLLLVVVSVMLPWRFPLPPPG